MAGLLFKCILIFCYANIGVNAETPTLTATACSSTIAPKYGQPSVAAGWGARVVASGLTDPRGILFDSNGHLLVVQQGKGVSSLELQDDGGLCVTAGRPKDIIVDNSLNHGLQLSTDGKTLYASSSDAVYSYAYDAITASNTSAARTLIEGMASGGHVTRTLLMSRKAEGLLLVSRGSSSNLDYEAKDIASGHCQIRAFNTTNVTSTAYDYAKDGLLLGWGLRNSVGVAEDPLTGAIYSVENSVDEITREGKNVHQDNPGEELNFHGFLNGTATREQGQNYGYPTCFAAWDVAALPSNHGLQVGTQFAIGEQNATVNDTFCQKDRIAPRLTFAAHMAPLDIKFNDQGTAAWITFHGSWDRSEPIGYKLSVVELTNGFPTAPANSTTSTIDILSNPDISKCPESCIRPVGLAWDSKGRLFMSSDATGEIYVIGRSDGTPANSPSPTNSAPYGTPAPTSTRVRGAAPEKLVQQQNHWAMLLAGIMALPLT